MNLNCHSYHGVGYGTLSIEGLVQQAVDCKVSVLALTDINTATGIYDFSKACIKAGIKPIVGVEIRDAFHRLLYIALAKQQSGIGEICRLLAAHNCEGKELPETAPDFENVLTIYPSSNVPEHLKQNE